MLLHQRHKLLCYRAKLNYWFELYWFNWRFGEIIYYDCSCFGPQEGTGIVCESPRYMKFFFFFFFASKSKWTLLKWNTFNLLCGGSDFTRDWIASQKQTKKQTVKTIFHFHQRKETAMFNQNISIFLSLTGDHVWGADWTMLTVQMWGVSAVDHQPVSCCSATLLFCLLTPSIGQCWQ